jgi:hypothetical protein
VTGVLEEDGGGGGDSKAMDKHTKKKRSYLYSFYLTSPPSLLWSFSFLFLLIIFLKSKILVFDELLI